MARVKKYWFEISVASAWGIIFLLIVGLGGCLSTDKESNPSSASRGGDTVTSSSVQGTGNQSSVNTSNSSEVSSSTKNVQNELWAWVIALGLVALLQTGGTVVLVWIIISRANAQQIPQIVEKINGAAKKLFPG